MTLIQRALDLNTAWSPSALDSAALAPQLFAVSLLPYLVFLFLASKEEVKMPKMTLFGFGFLLVFVGATIPAGIYAKVHYGTSLANVDWLHGSAESLLTVTNLLICLGLRAGIREARDQDSNLKSGAEILKDREE
jgi:hypothetical protein